MSAFTMRASTLRGGDILRAATVTSSPTATISPGAAISIGGHSRSMLSLTRGDTALLALTVSGLSALGLSGAQLWFTVKRNLSDADSAAVMQKTVGAGISTTGTGNNDTAGTALITVQPSDTASLVDAEQLLLFDVQLQDANGVKTTLCSGYVTILPDVTLA